MSPADRREVNAGLARAGYGKWKIGRYGDTVKCPHGAEIEIDGECSRGCVSPVLSLLFR